MKHLLRTLVMLFLLAGVVGFASYHLSSSPTLHAAVRKNDAMAWLRADFHLDDAQFAQIQRLHDAYAPSCEEHWRLISEATRRRDALRISAGTEAAATAEAERSLQELRATCEAAIMVHVRQVAAVMARDDARRYLALVLPKIAEVDRQDAPDGSMERRLRH